MSTSSRATIEQDLLRLDTQLGITNKLEKINKENRLRIIKGWLSEQDKVLLIFDNVVNHAEYTKYLPGGSVHVLGTSRDREMRNAMIMEKFSTREVEVYFERIFGEEHGYDKGDIKELGDELEGLPLAIRQAVAMLDNRGKFGEPLSIQDYLVRYRTIHRERFLDYPVPEHVSVATTVAIICEEIERQDPDCGQEAIRIADLCGFCASKAIPQELIHKWRLKGHPSRGDDREKLQRTDTCLELLSRYCMIDMGAKTVNIHQVVQAVIRVKMGANERLLYGKVVELMGEEYQFDGLDRNNSWQRCEVLHAHVMRVLGEEELFSVIPANKIAALLMDTGIFSWHKDPREFVDAERLILYSKKILDKAKMEKSVLMVKCLMYLGTLQNLSPEHLSSELAKSKTSQDIEREHQHTKLSRLEAACRILNSLEVLDPEGAELMAMVLDEQATHQIEMKQFDAARKLVDDGMGCLPENHPGLAHLAETIGDIYVKQEKYDHALEWYLKSDAIYQFHYPATHFFRMMSQFNLGMTFKELESTENAKLCFEFFLEHSGKSHTLVRESIVISQLSEIGLFFVNIGNDEHAKVILDGVVERSLSIHAAEEFSQIGVDKKTIKTMMKMESQLMLSLNRAERLFTKKRYIECEIEVKRIMPSIDRYLAMLRSIRSSEFQENLRLSNTFCSEGRPKAVFRTWAYDMLANSQLKQDKFDEASANYELGIQVVKEEDPMGVETLLKSYNTVGDRYKEKGESELALITYRRIMTFIEANFLETHEMLLEQLCVRIMNLPREFVSVEVEAEVAQRGIELHKKYEFGLEDEVRENNHTIFYVRLSLAQSALGMDEIAMVNFYIAKQRNSKLLGLDSEDETDMHGLSSLSLTSDGSYDSDIELDNELEIVIVKSAIEAPDLSNEESKQLLGTCNNIMEHFASEQKYDEAEAYFSSVIETLEERHPHCVFLITNVRLILGDVFYYQDKHFDAESCFRSAIDRIVSSEDMFLREGLARACKLLGDCLVSQSRAIEAEESYVMAVAAFTSLDDPSHQEDLEEISGILVSLEGVME